MKHIKKFTFLILILAAGVYYFSFVDSWEVYARPVREAKDRFEQWEAKRNGSVTQGDAGMDVSGGDSGKNEAEPESGSAEMGTETGGTDGSSAETDAVCQGTEEAAAGEENGTGQEQNPGAGDQTQNPDAGIGQNPDAGIGQNPDAERKPEDVEYITVEDDYFSDAVFIGDSRTVGMFEYGGLENISTFYASKGLTVYTMFDSPIVTVPGQKEKQTVEQALTENKFSKIYLMIGINEMGTGNVESFMKKYAEVVEHLKELQPDAIIYLQSIMKVTTARSNKGDYINNEGIDARNAEIQKLADYNKVYYLDVNPPVCDDTGGMEPSYTFDGVHLKGQYVTIWKDFLKTHAVEVPAQP